MRCDSFAGLLRPVVLLWTGCPMSQNIIQIESRDHQAAKQLLPLVYWRPNG